MKNVAVDSSVLYALFDAGDRAHADAVRFLAEPSLVLITTVPVLTEVVYLLDYSRDAQKAFLVWAHRSLDIDEAVGHELPRIAEIMKRYSDLPADFADAALVAMCERRQIGHVATLDHDFDVYRLDNKNLLTNVFRS